MSGVSPLPRFDHPIWLKKNVEEMFSELQVHSGMLLMLIRTDYPSIIIEMMS
jgi:hypothetical protein